MHIPRPLYRLAGALLVAAALVGCSAPQRPERIAVGDLDYAKRHLAWLIERTRGQFDVPGMSIALVLDGELAWSAGFGLADREAAIPATAETRYRVGGVTQLLTAATALTLAEQGVWSLDRPLAEGLPGLRPRNPFEGAPAITPRLALAHRSGLPSEWMAGQWSPAPTPLAELPGRLDPLYLEERPGRVHYSNLAYALVGAAMERAGGEPYPALVERLILQPAGMAGADFGAGAGRARGYVAAGEVERDDLPRDLPAVGLVSDAPALARFLALLMAGGHNAEGQAVLSPAVIAAMAEPAGPATPFDFDQRPGLGWFVTDDPLTGTRRLSQVGVTPHFQSFVALLPEERAAVVVLANRGGSAEAVASVGEEALHRLWESATGRLWPEGERVVALPDGAVSDPAGLAGRYATAYGYARAELDGAGLKVTLEDRAVDLRHDEDGRYTLAVRLAGVIPLEVERFGLGLVSVEGRELLLAEQLGQVVPIGERLAPLPIPEAWRARLGRWRVTGDDGRIAAWAERGRVELSVEEGLLRATLAREGEAAERLHLAPLGGDRAVVRGIGYHKGGMVTVTREAGEEVIHYSGLALRRAAGE